MTAAQRADLARLKQHELADQVAHNRRPITTSIQDLRRRKGRRRDRQRMRSWVRERQQRGA